VRRIAVVKRGDLGDLLLTLPALRALRDALPEATIDLLGSRVAREVLRDLNLVDQVLPLPSSHPHLLRGCIDGLRLAVSLVRRGYEAAILLEHLTTPAGALRYAAALTATRARRRIGLDNGRGWFLTDRVPDAGFGTRHEADHWLSVVSRLGANPTPRRVGLADDPAADARADAIVGAAGDRYCALHPGGGGYSVARRWPLDRFVEVGRALARDGHGLIVVGNESDLNGALAAATGAIDLTGQTPLRVLRRVLSRAALLISSDSGIVHVGATTDVPILAIYGLTDVRAWGPYRPESWLQTRTRVVERPLPCRPCLYRGHALGFRNGCATRDCLMGIGSARVIDLARELLAGSAADRRGALSG